VRPPAGPRFEQSEGGPMATYDIVIKGGMLDRRDATQVRATWACATARRRDRPHPGVGGLARVDAAGLHVAPGFVRPPHPLRRPGVRDPLPHAVGGGVTSVAIGNCGFRLRLRRRPEREDAMRLMTRRGCPYDAMREGMPWTGELPRSSSTRSPARRRR
jgi:N-acyl-D-aspartate/D-glutamate deacylase